MGLTIFIRHSDLSDGNCCHDEIIDKRMNRDCRISLFREVLSMNNAKTKVNGRKDYSVLNLVAIGEKAETKKAYIDADLHTENVHYGKY